MINDNWEMKVKSIVLWAIIAVQMITACQYRQAAQTQQVEQTRYYYWVCRQGEHQGAKIVFARMGNVFRGEYTDPGFQERNIAIMGMIDDEGKVTGVSAIMSEGDIAGKLSGKITGEKFDAVWLPSPTGMEISEYREMELVINTTGEQKKGELPSLPETAFTENLYGYTSGEWEMKLIHVEQGAKKEEVFFHLHIEESGIDEVIIDIQGDAQVNGNSFRYKEKDYEFEIAAYNGFITLKTISGDLDGYKADGVYPEIIINDIFNVN